MRIWKSNGIQRIGRWIELWLKILILSCNHREMWEPRCEHKSFQAFIIRKLRKSLSGNFCFNFKIEDKATCWKIQTVRLTPNGEISWLMKFRTSRQGLGTNLRLMRASLVPQMVMNLQQCRRPSWIPGLGKSPGEGNGNPLHYSCLENPWIEEPGGLHSPWGRKTGHNWMTNIFSFKVHDDEFIVSPIYPIAWFSLILLVS